MEEKKFLNDKFLSYLVSRLYGQQNVQCEKRYLSILKHPYILNFINQKLDDAIGFYLVQFVMIVAFVLFWFAPLDVAFYGVPISFATFIMSVVRFIILKIEIFSISLKRFGYSIIKTVKRNMYFS